jgi:DNA mismatch repair protein MutS
MGKSYLSATDLRHPIIELLNTDNEYIPTTIELGTFTQKDGSIQNGSTQNGSTQKGSTQDGILLFGLNSAGKSSLQKSIGIAIIMAQMGYPVACKQFVYFPYTSLFTRISSNDNIFKGLSSFALEMSEFVIIFISREFKNRPNCRQEASMPINSIKRANCKSFM